MTDYDIVRDVCTIMSAALPFRFGQGIDHEGMKASYGHHDVYLLEILD